MAHTKAEPTPPESFEPADRLSPIDQASPNDEAIRPELERLRAELDRTKAELLHAREAAALKEQTSEASGDMREHFLSAISHELRTPLSAILLWTSLIEDHKMVERAQLSQALDAIKHSAEELRDLIELLVDQSRILAGKFQLDLQPVAPVEIVQASIDATAYLVREKRLELTQRLDGTLAPVALDAARLKQVLVSLISNSIKFTPVGGHVTVELRGGVEGLIISVSDTGVGISATDLPLLFSRLVRPGKTVNRQPSGIGLGLTLAKKIVEKHGGRLVADSPGEQRGSTFSIVLPGSSVSSVSPPDGKLKDRQILLINDWSAARHELSTTLSNAGATVTAVDSAAAAWEAMDRQTPHVIISALDLPTIDGHEFIRELRASEESNARAVPALALGKSAEPPATAEAINSGFQSYLCCPAEPAELIRAVGELLDS
jgi:signal transduction histidine kinase